MIPFSLKLLRFILLIFSITISDAMAKEKECKTENALVLYYSKSGNTKNVAESIAASLKCDVIEIRENEQRKDGIMGFLNTAYDSLIKKEASIIYPKIDYSKYSKVLIGSPIWSSALSLPIRQYLKEFSNDRSQAAASSTSSSKPFPVYGIFYTCGGTPHSILESIIKKESEAIVGHAPFLVKGLNGSELQTPSTKSMWINKLKEFFQHP